MLDVNISGFRAACQTAIRELERIASDAVEAGAQGAEKEALSRIRSSTQRRTGALEDGTLSYQRSSREAFFISTAKHARYIDEGTVPHVIEARRAKMLRFVKGGTVFFRRRVNHPGTKPRPFVRPAMGAGDLAMQFAAQRGIAWLCDNFNR